MTKIFATTEMRQSQFMKLTEAQRNQYMLNGEPAYEMVGRFKDGQYVQEYFPALNGIAIGLPAKNEADAIAKAAEYRTHLAKQPRETVDEHALELDHEADKLSKSILARLVRVVSVVHIGTIDENRLPQAFIDMIDQLVDQDSADAYKDLPFLKVDQNDETLDAEDAYQLMTDYGALGFLVQASMPTITYQKDGTARISERTRRTNIFYGSNYEAAVRKAVAWERESHEEAQRRIAILTD